METKNKNYEERLIEIDNKIEDLKEHKKMFVTAGGHGLKMALQVDEDIYKLEEEKSRIQNGTQEKVDQIADKINELKLLKAQCKAINFIKKTKINKKVHSYEQEMEQILRRR